MASQAIARSESAVAFFPELERRIREAMDEGRFPDLAIAVVVETGRCSRLGGIEPPSSPVHG